MIYAVITISSLIAALINYVYLKKKHLRISMLQYFLEAVIFWILSYGIFYLKAYINYGYWNIEINALSTIITGIVVGTVLTVLGILIHAFIQQNKTDKYKTKCLFRVKGIQVFPLNSIIYAVAGLFIVLAGLFLAENVMNKDKSYVEWEREDNTIYNMNNEKIYKKLYSETKYPLVKIRDTVIDKHADIKILVLGDSFVFGFGSNNLNNLWWNKLSNELKSRGYDCEVYAAAYMWAGTYNELQWLTTTSMVADLDPDIIIIGYVTNDIESYTAGRTSNQGIYYSSFSEINYTPFVKLCTKFWPNVFKVIDYKLSERLGPFELFSDKIGYQYATWEMKQIEGDNLAQYNSKVIKPLGKFAASIDIPIILVTTPNMLDRNYFEPRYAPILPLFEQVGIKTYNMLNDFCDTFSANEDKYKDNIFISPAEPHPGTATTWFYSKYVANILESDYPQILGKKTLTGKDSFNIEVNDWMPYSLKPKKISESVTASKYVISYPNEGSGDSFLTMPVNEEYVKLNFKYPVDISTVTIEGKKINSATLYVTGINNELGFDDQIMHNIGKKNGQICNWSDESSLRVTSLCIHAETPDRTGDQLTVTITCKKGGAHP